MGAKVLGTHAAAAGVPADVFQGSANGDTFNLRIVNNDPVNQAKIKASLSTVSATMQDAGRIHPEDLVLNPSSMRSLNGLTISNTHYCVVQSDIVDVNFVALGVET